ARGTRRGGGPVAARRAPVGRGADALPARLLSAPLDPPARGQLCPDQLSGADLGQPPGAAEARAPREAGPSRGVLVEAEQVPARPGGDGLRRRLLPRRRR